MRGGRGIQEIEPFLQGERHCNYSMGLNVGLRCFHNRVWEQIRDEASARKARGEENSRVQAQDDQDLDNVLRYVGGLLDDVEISPARLSDGFSRVVRKEWAKPNRAPACGMGCRQHSHVQ